jgi:hypothetical protein
MATERREKKKKRKGACFLPLVLRDKAFTPQGKGRKESNKEEKNNN